MVTIKDIARESGYSISTVSRVLNHRNDVSPDAKKKIEEVVEKFHFVPNNNAKHLKQSNTKTIVVLVKGISNYETNGDHRCNFTGNVDLERLFTSLSGIGYQKIQDDSNRHSVLKRWLWSSRLGYDDGNACTCNCSNCSFLCGLSEIYY